MRRRLTALGLAVGISAAVAAPAAAFNPFGPDFHSNCTAGFAVGSTLNGGGATELSVIAQPPKTATVPPLKSDAGALSSTNCE
jgi:hypothetical protein